MTYVVRPADLKTEHRSILALWSRNSDAVDLERFRWIYEANPAGPGLAWVVTTSSGELVGCAGLASRTMKIDAGQFQTAQAIDLMVDARHRIAGPAMLLQRTVTTSSHDRQAALIYAFPNRRSEGVLRRAGYKLVGSLSSWTKPLRSSSKIRHYLPSNWTMKTTAAVTDTLLWFTSGEWAYRGSAGCRTDMLETFDRRFDVLWERASSQFPIIGDRSSAFLQWRFGKYPARTYRIFCLLDSRDELQAYLVFHPSDQRAVVSDLLATNPLALRTLLVEFSRKMRSDGIQGLSLVYCGASRVAQTLRSVGFYRRAKDNSVLVYPGTTPLSDTELLNEDNWYLTEADRDV